MTRPSETPALVCHLCGRTSIVLQPAFGSLTRVTSDCRVWRKNGRLGVCATCGGVQKPTDAEWQAEAAEIYAGYDLYRQSGGQEQFVFDAVSGQGSTRSSEIIARVRQVVSIASSGRLLDVGAGNGAFLEAFGRAAPGWAMFAQDLNTRSESRLKQIPGVQALYTDPPHQVPGQFDLISLIHVLEHVPEPAPFLSGLVARLAKRGRLIVEVPNVARNPFDLLIADHCTHFTTASLSGVLADAGYAADALSDGWIAKELTAVAGAQPSAPRGEEGQPGDVLATIASQIDWLRAVADQARALAAQHELGVFGTSIAAAWLFGEIDDAVAYFVDEDERRVGKTFMGLPVRHPRELPAGAHVYVCLANAVAQAVAQRFRRADAPFVLVTPPDSTDPAS